MEYKYSDKIKEMKPSAIREILKYASDSSVIPLSAGNPAPEAFPSKEIAEITADILHNNPVSALQYGVTEGYAPLRDYLKQYLKAHDKIGCENDDILVTNGAQQVMELTVKVLCNEGDTVICEDPTFIGSLNAFRSLGANIVGVPIEGDGICIEALETALKENKNAKFIYTIPNFHNPTGLTMSLDKRKAVYRLAKQYGVLILEDNPYGELRYVGDNIPSIKSMDTEDLVIYAGSFSKVISPGLRVGYAVANAELLKKLVVAKQVEDVHTNMLAQMICHRFMTEYDFDGHLDRLRALYSKKAAWADLQLKQYFSAAGIEWTAPQGGLFIWCSLPKTMDMPQFCTKAIKECRVAVVPGSAFLVDEKGTTSSFRINFSTPTNEQIEEGIKRLATLI